MKYILQHPIHEAITAWDNPAKTHAQRDTTHTHNDVESYAGVAKFGKVEAGWRTLSSTATQIATDAKSIAGQMA
jgi:hypothetical protein